MLLVFFMNPFPPAPEYPIRTIWNFFEKFAEIFASQGALPVSTTPAAKLPQVSTTLTANFATSFASVVEIGRKFATGVNDTRDKFAAGTCTCRDIPIALSRRMLETLLLDEDSHLLTWFISTVLKIFNAVLCNFLVAFRPIFFAASDYFHSFFSNLLNC